jgi:hypothetical protein
MKNEELRFCKVLGELSPNATWVKDGDEIEVKADIHTKYPIFYGKHSGGICGINYQPEPGEYLMVKCPTCSTFH